jgi:outer membrane cobalamin receptor
MVTKSVKLGIIILLFLGIRIHLFGEPGNSSTKTSETKGIIKGRVLDKETQLPLIGTNVVLIGTGLGATTDLDGRYFISDLSPGVYVLEISYIGYRTKRIENLQVVADTEVFLDTDMEQEALQLNEIVITPGQFIVKGKEPIVRQTLTQQDLQTIPFGEDIYRAITRLPGVTSGDFSAKFTVRGGENEEVLVMIDGQQLYEPFHLKDLDGGAISIIDVEAIEGIDLYTGGFPAEYGEGLSGVFNMKSASPYLGKSQTSLGISFMNARLMSAGNFNQNKGSWLVSARRGYLDLVLDLMGEENQPSPTYYDLFSKVEYSLNPKYTLTASLLHSGDKFENIEDDRDVDNTKYGNTYGWLTLNSMQSSRIFTQTILSYGRLSHNRNGTGYYGDSSELDFTVSDRNSVNIIGFKQDWDFELSQNYYLKWGINYQYLNADYDYLNTKWNRTWVSLTNYILSIDTVNTKLNPSGNRFGTYFSNRFRFWSPLTAEIGLRYDFNSYTEDHHFSPRVNLVYAIGKQTFLRGGWGYFYQSEGIHELKVADGETQFFPAELSRHWVAGFEHTFGNGLNLRLEGYYKKNSELRPDYRTFSNTIEIFPEVQDDRFKLTFNDANSKGIEFYLKYDRGSKISCWASYALAKADENIRNLVYQGVVYPALETAYPNRYDQRHTIFLDFNYRPNRKWHFNVSWQYHSGWPFTRRILQSEQLPNGNIQYSVVYGEFNGSPFPPFHRLDVQINRHFYLSRGRLSLFLAVINLYDRDNLRNIKYNVNTRPDGKPYLVELKEYWFRLLPSVGLSWTWTH